MTDALNTSTKRKRVALESRAFCTEGAGCRYINHEDDLETAIEYAGDSQDRENLE